MQRRTGTLVRRVNSRIRRTTPLFSDDELFAHTRVVQVDAIEYVIDRLYEEMGGDTYNTEHCSGLLLDYRRSESALRARPNMGISAEAQEQAEEVKRESYGIELGVIQDMYEAGDITRAQSKQLRRNVYVMSVDADAQICTFFRFPAFGSRGDGRLRNGGRSAGIASSRNRVRRELCQIAPERNRHRILRKFSENTRHALSIRCLYMNCQQKQADQEP